jgi:hypothetical protein
MITAIFHTAEGDAVVRQHCGYLEGGPIEVQAPNEDVEELIRGWADGAVGMWGHGMGDLDHAVQYDLDAALNDPNNPYMRRWKPEITVTGKCPLPSTLTIPKGQIG